MVNARKLAEKVRLPYAQRRKLTVSGRRRIRGQANVVEHNLIIGLPYVSRMHPCAMNVSRCVGSCQSSCVMKALSFSLADVIKIFRSRGSLEPRTYFFESYSELQVLPFVVGDLKYR